MLRLGHLFHGRKGMDEKPAEKSELLSSRAVLMDIYGRLRLTTFGNIVLSRPEEIEAAKFLESKGLARIETEYYVDGRKGMQSRVYLVWTGGWSCGDCINAENCPTNKGTWVHDVNFGKRCQKFMHKKLVEVLGDV